MLINASRMDTFSKCNRKYFWGSVFNYGDDGLGIQPGRPDENLKFGEVVHLGLADYYRGLRGSQLLKIYREQALTVLDFDALDWDSRNHWLDNLDWVDRILREYEIWAETTDDFIVKHVETEGVVILGELCWKCGTPYPSDRFSSCQRCLTEIHHLVYRIDLGVEQDGAYRVIDHKTAKTLGDSYLDSWRHSLALFGYAYGHRKTESLPVAGYAVNIVRKLKTIGEPEATMKACPECRNGAKKKLACVSCKGEGRVEKVSPTAGQPFVRVNESFSSTQESLLIRSRIRTIQDIQRETERFESEPDAAFPMNPTHCFSYGTCPFLKLCWNGNPAKWYEPHMGLLFDFNPRPADYVSVKTMAREEQT